MATEVAAEVRLRRAISEDQTEPSEAAEAAALADMRQQLKVGCPAGKGAACHQNPAYTQLDFSETAGCADHT